MRQRKRTDRSDSEFIGTAGLSRAPVAPDALRPNLDEHAWRVAEIRKAVKQADAGDFATDNELNATLTQWRVSAR